MRRHTLTIAAAAALLATPIASGEPVQQGDLRLDFSAGFAPRALPRERAAPVNVTVGGSIATVDGSRPPQLRRISIAVNRFGKVNTRGLPTCRAGQLESTSSREALRRCRGALVGRGRFGANVDFTKRAFPVEGKVLAFNGGTRRHPTLLIHIYGSNPVNVTIVLPFRISRPARGNFGTVFSARIPTIASDVGYVTDLSLRFDRRFRFGGRRRGFFNARCAAPPGFTGGPFSFIQGRFAFANGQRLTTTLIRFCSVR